MDVNHLNEFGLAIFERAIRWAADSSGTDTSTYFITTERDARLGGLNFTDVDIVAYMPWNDKAHFFFLGGATTLNADIDALHILGNGNLLLSTKGNASLGGLDFKDGDLVEYDIENDTSTLVFDGETLFGDNKAKITSVHLLDNGHLVLSTDKSGTLGGLSYTDRDLIEYDLATDTASMFFDGSTTTLNNKITGVQVLANGHLVLSTKGSATLGGLSFDASDLIDYDPINDTAEMIFDGSELFTDSDEKIISVHISSGSGSVTTGGTCNGTFRDEFNSVSLSGSDGNLDWSGDWAEVGESDGPGAGDTRISNDESDYQLLTRDNSNGGVGVERELDLSGAASVTLNYLYRRDLKNADDYTTVDIRDGNTASPWSELTRHQGPANDKKYESATHDISSFASSRTQIRFRTAPTMGGNEEVWFDDIQVLCGP